MAQNTFPIFNDMIPTAEDIQLIVDSLRQEDRYRTTKDTIFNPGIVNKEGTYLEAGTKADSLRINPFIAYTANGNRIEVSSAWDNLYAQGSVIPVTADNAVNENINIPVWKKYIKNYSNLDESDTTQTLDLATLGRGSILHGIKVSIDSLFSITDATNQPNIWISIGTGSELDKFLPETLVSSYESSQNISVMNLMYSINNSQPTDVKITFRSDSANLNTLTNGSLAINLCVANLEGYDNSDINQIDGGYELNNIAGNWQPSTTYHIVARYTEVKSDERQLNYTTLDGTNIITPLKPTRTTSSYKFYALRKSGSTIDFTSLDDVKLGEVVTGPLDEEDKSHIISIKINGKNNNGDDYTQYLTIPGYRFKDGINANQIGNGDVTNTQFSYLNTLTGNVQSQLSSKAGLTTDNTFTGINTFTQQIKGSIDKVNGYTAYTTPVPNSLLVLDENGKVPASAISENTVASIGNIYTVSSGVTTNGRSDFLTANSGNTGVVVKASSENPLVINYSDGSSETFIEDQEVTSVSTDGNYYLVKEKDGNFVLLPTAGGTKAAIPNVNSNNSFEYEGTEGGQVVCSFEPSTAYTAFDGTITTGTEMGKIEYFNYQNTMNFNIERTICYPASGDTSLIIHFPIAVVPTAFQSCFRINQTDATPKSFKLEATNDDYIDETAVWTPLYTGTNITWDINEIKTLSTATVTTAYKNYKLSFTVTEDTINNYIKGERTPSSGVSMPIKCYYFQLYTNVDSSNKGNIVEGYVKPSGMNMGSYFLDISKKPFVGYKCVGNDEFEEVNFVKLGFIEITGLSDSIDNNTIISCYPLCYNTFTISDNNSVSAGLDIEFNHNLGLIPNIVKVRYVCLSINNNYNVGDYVDNLYSIDQVEIDSDETVSITSSVNDTLSTDVMTITLRPGSNLFVKDKLTGVFGSVSNNQWAAIIYCARGW